MDERKEIQKAHKHVMRQEYGKAKAILKKLHSDEARKMLTNVSNLESAVVDLRSSPFKAKVRVEMPPKKRRGLWARLFGK